MSYIYHIIDASSTHHAPNVIKNTLQYSERCGIKTDVHRFVLFNYEADLGAPLNQLLASIDSGKIIRIAKKRKWLTLRTKLKAIRKENSGVILHGLNHNVLWITLLTLSKWDLSRFIWVCWGAGTTGSSSLKRKLSVDIAKKGILNRFGLIVVLLKKDKSLLRRSFGVENILVTPYLSQSIDFSSPIYKINGDLAPAEKPRVLIGNSAWATNNHLQIFDQLYSFKSNSLELICPLSYGADDHSYRDSVKKVGAEKFGENFIPIEQLLPTSKYMELINSVEIIVIYSDRQMALFALYVGVHLGKKIILKKGGANHDWFTTLGIKVFDFDDFTDFEDFARPLTLEERNHNKFSLAKFADIDKLASGWKRVYEVALGK